MRRHVLASKLGRMVVFVPNISKLGKSKPAYLHLILMQEPKIWGKRTFRPKFSAFLQPIFSVPMYNLLDHVLRWFSMWTFHSALNSTFSSRFWNGLKLNFRRLGSWLESEARRISLRKLHEGLPFAAKASCSKIHKWCVTQTAKV